MLWPKTSSLVADIQLCEARGGRGANCEFAAWGVCRLDSKIFPRTINSGTYPNSVQMGEPPTGCKLFAFHLSQLGNI